MEDIFDKEEEKDEMKDKGFSISFSMKQEGDRIKGKISFKPSEGLNEKHQEFLEKMFNEIIPQINKKGFPKMFFPNMFDRRPRVFPKIIPKMICPKEESLEMGNGWESFNTFF